MTRILLISIHSEVQGKRTVYDQKYSIQAEGNACSKWEWHLNVGRRRNSGCHAEGGASHRVQAQVRTGCLCCAL